MDKQLIVDIRNRVEYYKEHLACRLTECNME
jgi:hypothetical protein